MLKLAFTPRWVVFLLVVLALVSGFVALSRWQLNASVLGQVRADPAKEVVQPLRGLVSVHEPLTTEEADSMVRVTGRYIPGSSYLVADKLKDGRDGFWVVSRFVPDGADEVTVDARSQLVAVAVARAWTNETVLPPEPEGQVTVVGRLVANDAPYYSKDLAAGDGAGSRVIGSAAAAQLTNLWDAPLYAAIVAADAEVAGDRVELTAEGRLPEGAEIMGQSSSLLPVRAEQVTDEQVNWLNIFYALEWLVFAAFALYLWWRMLRDSYEKEDDPAQYFEYEGEYWLDPETGRYYYWDPQDRRYYFFDDIGTGTAAGTRK